MKIRAFTVFITALLATAGAEAFCKPDMSVKQVTETIVAAINNGNFQSFKSCIAQNASAHEPGRNFVGRTRLLAWAKGEIFDLKGRLIIAKSNRVGKKEFRCGKFKTPSFGFKVKYIFQAQKGQLTRWNLHYWKSKRCK